MVRDDPVTAAAEAEQREIAARVVIPSEPVPTPTTVAGVSYAVDSDRAVAAAILVDTGSGRTIDEVVVDGVVTFPYVPGLLAFREVPLVRAALDHLTIAPDVLLCDGHGIAHPRRCGLASHVGVLTNLPSIGVAKNHYVGEHSEPGHTRGSRSPLVDHGETVGEVLRTQDAVRPVYVSPGHLVGVARATELVLRLTSAYRLPDAIRRADHRSRQALREPPAGG